MGWSGSSFELIARLLNPVGPFQYVFKWNPGTVTTQIGEFIVFDNAEMHVANYGGFPGRGFPFGFEVEPDRT